MSVHELFRSSMLALLLLPEALSPNGAAPDDQDRNVRTAVIVTSSSPAVVQFDTPKSTIETALRRAPETRLKRLARPGRIMTFPSPHLHRSFWIHRFTYADTAGGSYSEVAATREVVTQHFNVWLSDALSNSVQVDLGRVERDAENGYVAIAGHFGSFDYESKQTAEGCHASGVRTREPAYLGNPHHRLTLLIVNKDEVGDGQNYADLRSFVPQSVLDCQGAVRSNEIPGLVVASIDRKLDPSLQYDGVLAFSLPHELQHIASFIHRVIVGRGSIQATFVDEGLSELAQDLALEQLFPELQGDAYGSGYPAREFLRAPGTCNILDFAGGPTEKTYQSYALTCYGAAYLLQRYLYDRFGDAYLQRIYSVRETGADAIASATGILFEESFVDFAAWLALPPAARRFPSDVDQFGQHYGFVPAFAAIGRSGDVRTLLPWSISFWQLGGSGEMPNISVSSGKARIVGL